MTTKLSYIDTAKARFQELQLQLMEHKYRYYIKAEPSISDYEYDTLERESMLTAKLLGFKADKWEGPENDEKNHVHWMVGFDTNHHLARLAMDEVDG